MHTVYTLRDDSGRVRYVGRTQKPLAVRLQQHNRHDGPVGTWIREQLDANRPVTIKEEKSWHGQFDYCAASFFERELIRYYREQMGDLLLNRESKRNSLLRVEENG